ncbi:hypothetical protein FACS189472_08370 [Alphaproteobacteria bacterium]|nr:hypothetical protein FACS189472_08370 [Alphaproteobacteria bacterium]
MKTTLLDLLRNRPLSGIFVIGACSTRVPSLSDPTSRWPKKSSDILGFATGLFNMVAFSSLLFITACDPVTWIVGGSAIAGTTAVRNQGGLSGSLSDSEIQTKINYKLFNKNKDILDRVELSVKHGMVVVIGYMKNEGQRKEAMRLIRSIKGIGEVFDETKVQTAPTGKDLAIDSSITSRIKSSLTFDSNVQSLNYDITTVKGVVYVCGTAQSIFERDVVLNHARATSGVVKVVAYVKINQKNKAKYRAR